MVCTTASIVRSLTIFSLTIVFLIAGCNNNGGIKDKSYGDSLTIVTYHAPVDISPLTAVSGISAILLETIFDGLIKLDQNLELRPHLAASWETSKDGLKWTFYLRKGVTFHDGVELTADDVKFTIEEFIRVNLRSPFAGWTANIKSINIKDRYAIDIVLKKPSIFFLYSMTWGILPAHILKNNNKNYNFGREPIGTGPFKFSSWKDSEIVLKANERYFSGRPYLNSIVVRVYPNQKIAWAKLMQGEGDFLFPVSPAEFDFLRQVSSLELYSIPGYIYSMVMFNNETYFFRDRKTRIALNYAVNKEHILQEILKGKGDVASGTIWPRSPVYNRAIRPYPYDPEKALKLLKEAGWHDNNMDHVLEREGRRFTFTLFVNGSDQTEIQAAMYIQQQLWDLGIMAEIETFSTSSMDFLFTGRYDAAFIDAFSHVYPDYNFYSWHSSQIGKGLNISRYRLDSVDRLLEEGRLSVDMGSARLLYNRFQEEMYSNPPGIFLYWPYQHMAVHKRFEGVKFIPGGLLSYINEWYVPKGEQKN